MAQSAGSLDIAAAPFADLTAAITVSPSLGQIGQTIDLAWVVTNDATHGLAATGNGPWYDRVVLSRDNVFGNADDINLGEFVRNGAVNLGASYTVAKTVPIPSTFFGDATLFVLADARNNVYEYTFENNNASAGRAITIQAPDLSVSGVLPTSATAVFGEPVGVNFTVQNTGTGPTTTAVRDRIWLSTNQALDGSDILLATIDAATLPLAAGGQYPRTNVLANLPLNASLAAGNYYLIVQADALGIQPETNETNNVTVSVTPVNITFPPLPDLRVAGITVDEATAGTLTSGGPMTIHWQTRNDGAAPVSGLFHERIVVTNGSQTVLNTTIVHDASGASAIGVGGAVDRSYAFTLPNGTLGAGSLSVSITTDVSNEVVEGFSGTTPETNNAASASFNSKLRPYPDLFVNLLSVSPTTVPSGQAITVSWQTENPGTETVTNAFTERVRIVNPTNGQELVNQTLLYDPAIDGNIAPGDEPRPVADGHHPRRLEECRHRDGDGHHRQRERRLRVQHGGYRRDEQRHQHTADGDAGPVPGPGGLRRHRDDRRGHRRPGADYRVLDRDEQRHPLGAGGRVGGHPLCVERHDLRQRRGDRPVPENRLAGRRGVLYAGPRRSCCRRRSPDVSTSSSRRTGPTPCSRTAPRRTTWPTPPAPST